MGLFELYRLDRPEAVVQTVEARTSEEALELAGNRLAPLFGGAVQVSVPLLTLAAPRGAAGGPPGGLPQKGGDGRMVTAEALDAAVVFLLYVAGILLTLGVGGLVADYIFPHIKPLGRFMDGLPMMDDEEEGPE